MRPNWRPHLVFVVDALPKGKGSMRPIKTKAGKVILAHSRDAVEFQELCSRAALRAVEELRAGSREDPKLQGAVAARCVFHLPRPQGHFGTGSKASQLRNSAPEHPAGKPDIDKLLRVVFDAMTGIVFHDDAQVVAIQAIKVYATDHPHLEVVVYRPAEQEKST